MAYAPRQRKYRIKLKILIPLLLLIALVIYAGVSVFLVKEEKKTSFTVCGFTPEKTVSVLNKKSAEIMSVSDYLYYGESLNLLIKAILHFIKIRWLVNLWFCIMYVMIVK